MTATDRITDAAVAVAAGGDPPDDPDPNPDVSVAPAHPDGACAAAAHPDAACCGIAGVDDDAVWALDIDTRLDRATAGRLRDEARRTRHRIERRLADAGHLPASDSRGGAPGRADSDVGQTRPGNVDERRDLGGRLDENIAFFEHIDALHERRLQSPSPRERQVATRALAEALHRIVSGYHVSDDPPHRPVMAARRADEWLGGVYARVAARGPQRQAATRWWALDGRWVRLGLALVACVLLSQNRLVPAALVVMLRSGLSAVLYAPPPAVGPRRRLLGYDPQWASYVCTHLGDAAIVIGLGLGLHLGGHTDWGVATVLAALFGLIATMIRMASGHHGFRMPRLWLDRAATTVVLPVAVVAAAVLPPQGPGTLWDVPVAASVMAVVIAIGAVEICRTFYFALCRRRLFRRAAAREGGLVPDAIVAHTADAIVVNLPRASARPPVFDLDDDDGRHLRAVGNGPPRPAKRAPKVGRRHQGR